MTVSSCGFEKYWANNVRRLTWLSVRPHFSIEMNPLLVWHIIDTKPMQLPPTYKTEGAVQGSTI